MHILGLLYGTSDAFHPLAYRRTYGHALMHCTTADTAAALAAAAPPQSTATAAAEFS
jgi:hypothetical protein